MDYSEEKTAFGFSAADIYRYREETGAGMEQAKKHFIDIYRAKKKAEMLELVESGTLEDLQKIVRILVQDY